MKHIDGQGLMRRRCCKHSVAHFSQKTHTYTQEVDGKVNPARGIRKKVNLIIYSLQIILK